MKAREHEKIMRERQRSWSAMQQRHAEFFKAELAEREAILDNYADALDHQDAEIAILTQMLLARGVSSEEIYRRMDSYFNVEETAQ